jgi:5'(3')-deoxyribonucleotidase
MSRLTVGLDMDGVAYDFVGAAIEWSGNSFKREDATSFNIFGSWGVEGLWAAFDRHAQEKDFCFNLKLLDGARAFVAELASMADVLVVTSPYRDAPYWAHEREKAVLRDFGFEREKVMSCRSKQYARVDVLIDDKPSNIESFTDAAILFDQPWNRDCNVGIRCKSYQEVLDVVRGMV